MRREEEEDDGEEEASEAREGQCVMGLCLRFGSYGFSVSAAGGAVSIDRDASVCVGCCKPDEDAGLALSAEETGLVSAAADIARPLEDLKPSPKRAAEEEVMAQMGTLSAGIVALGCSLVPQSC